MDGCLERMVRMDDDDGIKTVMNNMIDIRREETR
jgi:hypothetical protein